MSNWPSTGVNSFMALTASPSVAFTPCVAPNCLANSSLVSSKSTAMTGLAPRCAAAATAERPTPPTPIMATLSPCFTPAVWSTAPAPVMTAHPMMLSVSRSMSSGTFTTYISSAIVCVAHVKTLILVAVLPSGNFSSVAPPWRRA